MPVSSARKMLFPFFTDGLDRKQAMPPQRFRSQQVFRPLTQRPAKPQINRHSKSHLRPLHEPRRNMLIEHLAEHPLGFSIPDLEVQRQAPGKFHYAMVKQGDARFKAN